MSVILVYVDGLFCDSSYEIPSTEPDAHSLRWFQSLYDGSQEQFILACDAPDTNTVGQWLTNYGVKFSAIMTTDGEQDNARVERMMRFVGAQHAKIVLFIGARFYDCNRMADLGVPSLRYQPPNKSARWEPDKRSAWVKAIEKQQA